MFTVASVRHQFDDCQAAIYTICENGKCIFVGELDRGDEEYGAFWQYVRDNGLTYDGSIEHDMTVYYTRLEV